jgi:quercetin dioxygenase-like cupin family protein
MRHAMLDDALAADAALYALDALDPDETAAYRAHLDAGCAVCRAEVDALHAVASDLGLHAPPVAPPVALRERLLARAAAPPPELPAYHFLTAEEGRWIRIAPGIFRKDLASEPDGRSRSYLIRMEPGAVGGVHTHATVEHCLVVEGDFQTAGRALRAGDYHRAARGSTHAGNSTVGGCLVLIVEAEA